MLSITQLWLDGGLLTQAPRSQITDTQNPMFGCTAVSDTDGDGQTACRVTVADADGSLLWDSGWQQQPGQPPPHSTWNRHSLPLYSGPKGSPHPGMGVSTYYNHPEALKREKGEGPQLDRYGNAVRPMMPQKVQSVCGV